MQKMPTITEGSLRFYFPDNWVVLKYDADDGFYKRRLDKHFHNLKAVDIVAVDPAADLLVLLEVKDFRGHGVANRKRITTGELAKEVGQKVLHTLSGLYLGLRLQQPEFIVLQSQLLPLPNKLEVVLLLEEDAVGLSTIEEQNRDTNRQNLLIKLKSMFKPLKIKVHLHSRATVPQRAGWLVS